MDEKRRHPRTEVNEPGYVSSGGSVMHCTIVNISPEGAAIEVENPAFASLPPGDGQRRLGCHAPGDLEKEDADWPASPTA